MVRFFFDLDMDGVLLVDDTGLELASDEAAEDEALTALVEMAEQFAGSKGARRMAIAVRDETGASICTFGLSLSMTY